MMAYVTLCCICIPYFRLLICLRGLCLLCLLPLKRLYPCKIFHLYLLIIWIHPIPCNNQSGTLTRSTDDFFYVVVPDIMPHYHTHLFQRTKILTDCAHAPQHQRLLLYLHMHMAVNIDIWLVSVSHVQRELSLCRITISLATRAEKIRKNRCMYWSNGGML
jgi:hypothetical protein